MTLPLPDEPGAEETLRAILAHNLEKVLRQERTTWHPLPHQTPPPLDGDWLGWLHVAGRGSGKSAACAKFMVDHANGPPCVSEIEPHRMTIIGPTQGDASRSCYSGPAGIRAFDHAAQLKLTLDGKMVLWPNGSTAQVLGAHEPDDAERLRSAGNTCLVWCEELAAWRYMKEVWDQMRFGLRVGPHPRWIGSTTPKPRELIREFLDGKYRGVVVVHSTMYDNPYLPAHIRQALEDTYAGTALGQQELMGKYIEQDENALFTRENLEANRLDTAPELDRIVVGVDPSGGMGEQGIIVVGSRRVLGAHNNLRRHGYVLHDASVKLSPEGWSRRAVETAVDYDADTIVVETNFGGDMAVSTLVNAAEALGVAIPIKTVSASRGKQPRAEPVSALAEQGLWHLVGRFPVLEDQLCTWTRESKWSPDRLDAMVWPAWYLKIVSKTFRAVGTFGGSTMARRSLVRSR